jgi:hypothetical protein
MDSVEPPLYFYHQSPKFLYKIGFNSPEKAAQK